jgi:kynurenine 3-monooxygenase
MPDLFKDYKKNRVGSLVSIRTNPWNFGKIVLIGDAAHAVVPFYGQGMNAAFEDGLILYNIIKEEIEQQKQNKNNENKILNNNNINNIDNNNKQNIEINIDIKKCIEKFSNVRIPSINALSDLCLEHYRDMAVNTNDFFSLLKNKVEKALYYCFPKKFIPLYSLVAFTRTPYHEAVQIVKKREKMFLYYSSLTILGLVIYKLRK